MVVGVVVPALAAVSAAVVARPQAEVLSTAVILAHLEPVGSMRLVIITVPSASSAALTAIIVSGRDDRGPIVVVIIALLCVVIRVAGVVTADGSRPAGRG